MIKDFKNFVKESIGNRGVGPGNDGLFQRTPKKQTINSSNPTMDFLRVGKHILTSKIDGFIDSVQNENVYIVDRVSGEIKRYSIKEVLKGIKEVKGENTPIEGFSGTPKWAEKKIIKENAQPNTDTNDDDEDDVTHEDELEDSEDLDSEELEIEELKEMLDISDEKKEYWEEGEEEKYQEQDRGTEDNPTGYNSGRKREMPNESWIKYWEKFNETHRHLIDEEDLEIEDIDEEIEEEVHGTEDNPIESRKRIKIENYSQDDEIGDDRFDQFA